MILAIDIGNSSVKFGLFERERLISRFSVPTVRTQNADEIYALIRNENLQEVSAIIISSVVPELRQSFEILGEKFLRAETVFLNNGFDFGLKILYNPPEKLGVDRICAAYAATEKYGAPVIVCDFGTATTIDAVNAKREFSGGIITPGIQTLSDALFLRASQLPHVEIKKPETVFGKSTVECIQAGVFFGYIGLTEGILRRMLAELGEKPQIVATGGFAGLLAENCNLIDVVDENLMLEGLRRIYEKTSAAKREAFE
jgi:pantothenate kinase, type III